MSHNITILTRRSVYVAAAMLAAMATQPAWAIDEVVKESTGESIKGEITSVSKTSVDVEQTGKTVSVPVTDLAEIRWDGEPPELNITRIRENNGDLAEALESYRSLAGQVGADNANLQTDVEFLIARTLARQALNDPSHKAAAVKALDEFTTNHANSIRYYPALQWLGRVHLAADEFGPAKVTYQRLAQAEPPELKMAGQNALGRVKLQEGDFPGALDDFEQVLQSQTEGPAALRQHYAAKLGKARVLQEQDDADHKAALETLNEVINNASPDNATVQAEAFLRKGVSLQSLGQDQDALLAFLHVDILFSGQPESHAEALFHLVRLWDSAGKPQRSAEARRMLTERYPASQWAQQL